MGSIDSAFGAGISDPKTKVQTIVELVDDAQDGPTTNGHGVQDEWTYPYPTNFKISEHPIDEVRTLKVGIVGSGLAGLTAGALLPAKQAHVLYLVVLVLALIIEQGSRH